MKTRTKVALTALCALLLVAASVLGTLAYLTSITGPVENTFTAGNVVITLDEAKTNEYGEEISNADRVYGNELKLVPNHVYVKDPTVHVTADSEPCWVFVKVTDGTVALQDTTNTVAKQIVEDNGWTQLTVEGTPVPGVYYKDHAAIGAADYVVFNTLDIAQDANVSTVTNDTKLTVVGYAIQKDTLATAEAAWVTSGFGA